MNSVRAGISILRPWKIVWHVVDAQGTWGEWISHWINEWIDWPILIAALRRRLCIFLRWGNGSHSACTSRGAHRIHLMDSNALFLSFYPTASFTWRGLCGSLGFPEFEMRLAGVAYIHGPRFNEWTKSFILLEWLDCLPSLVEVRTQLAHLKINPESSLCPLISPPYLLPLLFWRKSWSGPAHHHIAALPANPVVFPLPGEHLQSIKGDMGVQRADRGWRGCLYFNVTLIQLLDAFHKRTKASLMSIRANTDWGVSAC